LQIIGHFLAFFYSRVPLFNRLVRGESQALGYKSGTKNLEASLYHNANISILKTA